MNRFLVIDDDEMSRCLLGNFLSEYAPCDLAASGREALDMIKHALQQGLPYTLLCVDLIMPEMNGHVLIRKVREMDAANPVLKDIRTKIFVISSSDSAWDKSELLLDGLCDDYIVKPFNRNDLRENLYKNELVVKRTDR